MMTPKQETQRKQMLTDAHTDFEKGLGRYAFFKLHDKAMSQDLVQETFLKIWTRLAAGGKIDTMKAFLYHVLNNLIIDEYRKNKTISLDQLLSKGFEPKTGDVEHLINVLDGKRALLLIQRLPERDQKVMKMRFVQGLTLTEMSLIMGQTKNTIAVQIHRGIARLRDLYNNKK